MAKTENVPGVGEGLKVKQITTDDCERTRAQIARLKKCKIKVGFQAGTTYKETGEDVVDVAARNEFGCNNIPSRPFMRNALEKYRADVNKFASKQLKKLGKTDFNVEVFLEQVAEYFKGCIQKEIVEGDFVPNSPYTIAKKGSDKPLIDTGQMRQSVTYVIEYDGKTDDDSKKKPDEESDDVQDENDFATLSGGGMGNASKVGGGQA